MLILLRDASQKFLWLNMDSIEYFTGNTVRLVSGRTIELDDVQRDKLEQSMKQYSPVYAQYGEAG